MENILVLAKRPRKNSLLDANGKAILVQCAMCGHKWYPRKRNADLKTRGGRRCPNFQCQVYVSESGRLSAGGG